MSGDRRLTSWLGESVTIGWGAIIRQMIRHSCGPNRAAEHEMARRYDVTRARSVPASASRWYRP